MNELTEPTGRTLSSSSSMSYQSRRWLVMRHLLWKDWLLVRSLVFIVLAITIIFNLVTAAMLWMSGVYTEDIGQWVSMRFIFPSMVAFGAPAMLVGTEEESGTLGWMRSLPITWQTIALSKFLIAIASVALASLVSVAVYAALIPMLNASLTDGGYSLSWERDYPDLLFAYALLLVALALAYLLKSPVASVVAILPAMAGIATAPALAEKLGWTRLSDLNVDVIFVLFVVSLLVIQYRAARWRLGQHGNLRRFWTTRPSNALSPVAIPYAPSISLTLRAKPTPRQALQWQSRHQQIWPTLGLSIGAVGCLVASSKYSESGWGKNSDQFIYLNAIGALSIISTWIGCLCFHGDSIRKRYAFFADRGLPAMSFWRSRLWIPSLAMIAIFIVSLIVFPSHRYRQPFAPSYLLVAFACGQLASIWMSRTSLTFVLGPALTFGVILSMQQLFYSYNRYFGYAWLAIIPLLIGTALLTRPWLESKRGFAFHARLVGYVLIAMLIVPIGVHIRRYVFVPAAMPEWRTQMLAEPMPAAFAQLADKKGEPHDYLAPWLATQDMTELKRDPKVAEFLGDSKEFADKMLDGYYYQILGKMGWRVQYGQRVDSPEMAVILEDKFYSWRLMLQWAKSARLAVTEGRLQPEFVLRNASIDELTVIGELSFLTGLNDGILPAAIQQEALSILNEFAPPDLQDESWRTAMIMEWQFFQQRQSPRSFANRSVDVAGNAVWRNFEQRRIDRYVDRATRSSLEWAGQKSESWLSNWQAQNTWWQVYGDRVHFTMVPIGSITENQVEDIRRELSP